VTASSPGQQAGGAVLPTSVVCVGVATAGVGEDLRVAAAFGDLDFGVAAVVARRASTNAVIAGASSIPDGMGMGADGATACVQAVEAWASTAWTMNQTGIPTSQWLSELNARLGVTAISPTVNTALTSGLQAVSANPDLNATIGLPVGPTPAGLAPAALPPPVGGLGPAGLGLV